MLMNTGSVTSENDVRGFTRTPEGTFIGTIADIDATKDDKISVKINVLGGTDPKGANLTHEENYFYKGEDGNREYSPGQIRLALVTGAIPPGAQAQPNWRATIGRPVVFTIAHRTSKKKGEGGKETESVYANIADWGCAIYSLQNPEIQGALQQPWAQECLARLNAPQVQQHQQPYAPPAPQPQAYQHPQGYPAQQAPAYPAAAAVPPGGGYAPPQQGYPQQQFAPPANPHMVPPAAPVAAGGKYAGL